MPVARRGEKWNNRVRGKLEEGGNRGGRWRKKVGIKQTLDNGLTGEE